MEPVWGWIVAWWSSSCSIIVGFILLTPFDGTCVMEWVVLVSSLGSFVASLALWWVWVTIIGWGAVHALVESLGCMVVVVHRFILVENISEDSSILSLQG